MKKLEKHIFICENVRDENHPTPSCGRNGGIENRAYLKKRLRELGLTQKIRANSSGCLGMCNHAPVAVIYPDGKWYGKISIQDVDEIIEKSLLNNENIERLDIKDD